MIVCVCRRVSDREIRQAVADGAVSLECLQIDLGVATQCGRCADCACKILGDAKAANAPCARDRHGHDHGHAHMHVHDHDHGHAPQVHCA